MDNDMNELIAIAGVIVAGAVAFGKSFGPFQMSISEAIIEAANIRTRYKRLLNLGVGVVLGVALTAVAAAYIGSWAMVPAGVLAGVLASTEANKTHDERDARRERASNTKS